VSGTANGNASTPTAADKVTRAEVNDTMMLVNE
jgi:hypothetical protein